MSDAPDAFAGLDTDLIVQILSYLKGCDIVKCRQLCCSFCSIVDVSVLLQYMIQCYIAGVVDGPNTSVILADRLDRLKRWQAARESLNWSNISVSQVEKPQKGAYFSTKAFGPVFCEQTGTSLKIIRPSSQLRGLSVMEWSLDLPFDPMAYACDYSQHLLVLVEQIDPHRENAWRIHFRSFITRLEHPSATSEDIIAEFRPPRARKCERDADDEPYEPGEDEEVDYLLEAQVHESLLVLTCQVFVPERTKYCAEVWVWNWKTGSLLLNFTKVLQDGEIHRVHFPLLDDRHILIPVENDDMWDPGPLRSNGVAVVGVYPGNEHRQSYGDVVREADFVLALPELIPRVYYSDIRLRFNPSPILHESWDKEAIFSCDPTVALLRISVEIDSHCGALGTPIHVVFVVPISTILGYMDPPFHRPGVAVVPWSRWADRACVSEMPEAWYPCEVSSTWCLQETSSYLELSRTRRGTLTDFATRPSLVLASAAKAQAAYDPDAPVESLEPTVLRKERLWAEPLRAGLSYRKYKDSFLLRRAYDQILLGDYYIVVHRSDLANSDSGPAHRDVYSI